MAETLTTAKETTTETVEQEGFNPFAKESWSETIRPKMEEKPKEEEKKVAPTSEVVPITEQTESIVDFETHFEKEFGKKPDVFKSEYEELRSAKEKAEIKFANEDSRKVFEALLAGKEDDVFETLQLKRQLTKAEQLDVTKPEQAGELIKLSLMLNHRNLEPYEISDLYNESYEKPEKPKQSLDETEEDYSSRVQGWQVRCDAIDRKIVRDAKMALPNIQKLKNEIVLPNIPKQEEEKVQQPTPEDLEKEKKYLDNFLQSVPTSVKELQGFNAQVKDKDVDFTVSYVPSNEEKQSIEQVLKNFGSEAQFNANALLAQAWVSEDGSINSKRMAEDLIFLANKEKILQKIATDAANQRLELYLKSKKNINVTEDFQTGKFEPKGNEQQNGLEQARAVAFS